MEEVANQPAVVAYFSMEIGLESAMATYSGGLGVLAGDSLRAGANLGIPMVGITLLYHKGYFRQHLDASGNQTESVVEWNPEQYIKVMDVRTSIIIEEREVWIRPWRYDIPSTNGTDAIVYFLDTALPENSSWDQTLTDYLYGGDDHYRLCQEAVLGLGGIAMLRALGYADVEAYHMNEGHSSLLTLALLKEQAQRSGQPITAKENVEWVREQCVFTTHTPVPAGMDKFPIPMVRQVLGDETTSILSQLACILGDSLNMIYLGLYFSRYINGVSMRHEEISHDMFPTYAINSITNGVHAATWTAEPFQHLFDRHIPEWRKDNLYLRYAIRIPLSEIREAHHVAKQALLDEIKRTGIDLNPSVMTIGFARRATPYKRATLLLSDLERLKKIAAGVGPLQIIYAGKAHPKDEWGKDVIRQVFRAASALKGIINVVYLEEYNLAMAKYLCSGVDLWLNTPQKPYEASGTSGMKAALNGVPSLSVLDGWWVEGHLEGVTGWSVGEAGEGANPRADAVSLYDKLEYIIVPMFYHQPNAFSTVMRSAIAVNGSYYNAQRMMFQYLEHAYMSPD
ncbi:MAG: alpha-glucan family phosphorylase [Chloroflexi bacterium]|nr:alpha-glucan family phosphorylase [Chloroflexota bacterium]